MCAPVPSHYDVLQPTVLARTKLCECLASEPAKPNLFISACVGHFITAVKKSPLQGGVIVNRVGNIYFSTILDVQTSKN